MKTIKLILKTIAFLTLLAVITSAGVFWWLWNRSETFLTDGIKKEIAKSLPEMDVDFERASFDSSGWIRIQNFVLKDQNDQHEILSMPDIRIAIDREAFARFQKIEIMRVRISRPKLTLNRRENGFWDIPEFPDMNVDSKARSAELEIENGTIVLKTEATAWNDPAQVVIKDFSTQVIPSGAQRYTFAGKASAGLAGPLQVSGDVDLKKQSWSIRGNMDELHAGNDLLNLVLAYIPDLKTKIHNLDVRSSGSKRNPFDQLAPGKTSPVKFVNQQRSLNNGSDAPLFQTASLEDKKSRGNLESNSPQQPTPLKGIDLGTDLLAKLQFELSSDDFKKIPDFKISTQIQDGHIVHPRLPFPIYGVQGKVKVESNRVTIDDFQGTNGLTQIKLAGEMSLGDESLDPENVDQVHLTITDLIVDDRLRAVLPDRKKKLFDELGVSGNANLKVIFYRRGSGPLQVFVSEVELKHCIAKYYKFPYPITSINGTIRQKPRVSPPLLIVDVQGKAGRRPVKMTGTISNPGANNEVILKAEATKVSVDDSFRIALQPKVRAYFKEMNIYGEADFKMNFYRPAGPKKPTNVQITSHFRNATFHWAKFPYAISNISGVATFANDGWLLSNLEGVHAGTRIHANGSLTPKDDEEILRFKFDATDAEFDETLRRAIAASSPNTLEAWTQLNPRGNFDIQVELWQPKGQVIDLVVPRLVAKQAEITVKSFPYRLHDVNAVVKKSGNDIEIQSFSGKHGRTGVKFRGGVNMNQDFWVLSMNNLQVDDLIFDHDLKRALPKSLLDGIATLRLNDPISFSSGDKGGVQLKGSIGKNPVVTAAWEGSTILSGSSMYAGLDLKNVRGVIFSSGNVDRNGYVKVDGRIELDSLEVLEYQVANVKGPFHIAGTDLLLGSEKTFLATNANSQQSEIRTQDRLTGDLFGGTISMDTMARLTSNPAFRSHIVLARAKLENWAKRSGFGQSNTSGVMTGWLDVEGQGNIEETLTGKGQLWITPAKIYELPIFIRLFKALQFVPPDKTAFKYAFTDFRMLPDRFVFDRINLVGDALSLVGGGHIRFNQLMDLNLVSIIPRNNIPIPILNQIINNPLLRETNKGWVRVQVTGKTTAPDVYVRAGVPILDNALRSMLKNFMGQPVEVAPQFTTPSVFEQPRIRNGDNRQRPGGN